MDRDLAIGLTILAIGLAWKGGIVEQVRNEFERLRALRQQIGEARTLDLDIPGYQGELVARYQMIDWSIVKKIIDRMEKLKTADKERRELYAQVDTIIAACDQIYYRNGSSDELQPLDPESPVKYDRKLANILGFDKEGLTARMVVLETFRNELAILGHHSELYTWLNGQREEVTEEVLGEL